MLSAHVLPESLSLLDDCETENQKKGLGSIQIILKENPAEVLRKYGWYPVIYASLRKLVNQLNEEKFCIYTCLDICLKNHEPLGLTEKELNKHDEYDKLIGEIIQSLTLDSSSRSLYSNLSILLLLSSSMQENIACHLHSILISLDSQITENVSQEIISLIFAVINKIIEFCWPCFDMKLCSQLSWILYKLYKHSGEDSKPVLHTKISFEILCGRVCPDLLTSVGDLT